jgi:hypothetical protein
MNFSLTVAEVEQLRSTKDCWIVEWMLNRPLKNGGIFPDFKAISVKIIHNYKHQLGDNMAMNIRRGINILELIGEVIHANPEKMKLVLCLRDEDVDYTPAFDLTELEDFNYKEEEKNGEKALRHCILTLMDPREQRVEFNPYPMIKAAKRTHDSD